MSGCAIALPAGCWLAPVLASRWRGGLEIRFPPQLRWGGVREADGGVMGVEEDDDPSGPYGPPPQLRWGGNPLPNENGAPQGPVLRLRSNGSDGHVLLRHHPIQHADREHGVEAAGIERGLG